MGIRHEDDGSLGQCGTRIERGFEIRRQPNLVYYFTVEFKNNDASIISFVLAQRALNPTSTTLFGQNVLPVGSALLPHAAPHSFAGRGAVPAENHANCT